MITLCLIGHESYILSILKSLQIVLYLMLLGLNYPPFTFQFFRPLMDIVNFQLIDTSKIYNREFNLDPDLRANSPLSVREK